jgi:predicted nucleic acid-binding Zn ribbon protein
VFCPQCGKDVPEDSQFCPKCGKPTSATTLKPKRELHVMKYVAGFLAAILLLLLIVNASSWFGQSHSQSATIAHGAGDALASPPAQTSLLSAVHELVPHEVVITNTAFTVRAAAYDFQKLTIPADAQNIFIDGHFTASGGFGNDIEVFVSSEDGFVNFQNGHGTPTYYNSGKVTTGNIGARLPSGGTYYLVWNNRFSILTPKAVQATATLHYTD